MRFIILVKATADSEAGVMPSDDTLWDEMSRYHEELARAGALLDASGLHPTANGWRVRFEGKNRTLVDGPFTEAKELIAGYTIIQVSSREEALEWTRRFPNPGANGGEIEVRQLFELEEFEPRPAIDRFREMRLPSQQ
jgi:hypothetical protein